MAATIPGNRLSTPSFDAVLDAARVGAGWAFERLWNELSGPVAGYVRTQGVADPDDLVSEVFLAAFTRIAAFEGDQARFRSWVFTIAHHKLVDHRRRRARRPDPEPLTGRHVAVPGGNVEHDAMAALGTGRVGALLDGLAPDQRDVLLLRILGDLTVDEVAHAVGKTPGAVKALQRRGLAALRKKIGETPYPFGGDRRLQD